MASLASKTALVTGSTSGIGLATVKSLLKNGCRVVVSGSRGPQEAEPIIIDLQSQNVRYVQADLTQETGMQSLCQQVDGLFPDGVDILVNNAGMNHVGTIEEVDLDTWNKMTAINFTAPFYLTKHFLPRMKLKGWGRIINVSSRLGLVGLARKSPYCATKHGLMGLTKSVALEAAVAGVTCNAVCPGWVDTPFVASQVENLSQKHNLSEEETKQRFMADTHPTGKIVTVDEISETIMFLCSAAANNITGTSIVMDGGKNAM